MCFFLISNAGSSFFRCCPSQERLIAEAARETERREAERAAAEAEKRARHKAEMMETNEELRRVKALREAAERDEARRLQVCVCVLCGAGVVYVCWG